MPMTLVLRRAQGHRPGDWDARDYNVLDDGREVGRIYRINAASEIWWWGVSFILTGRKSGGDAPMRNDAMAAFQAEYERWTKEQPRRPSRAPDHEVKRGGARFGAPTMRLSLHIDDRA